MAKLFSRWESGLQVTAGTMIGSIMGASGLNAFADRLNSISDNDDYVTAPYISGTSTNFYGANIGTPLATAIKQGVASFNSDDFTVSTGSVALANKTSYWSCNGFNFNALYPDTDDISYGGGIVEASANGIYFCAPISLPNGAVITGAIVYGNAQAAAEWWTLVRVNILTGASSAMSGNIQINTEDITINNATVDNSLYGYCFQTNSLDTGDQIYGGRVTYTTDYI